MNAKLTTALFVSLFSSAWVLCQNPGPKPDATVTYLSADLVYVDAGSANGVSVGDQFAFYRDGQWLANLVVVSVAENRASCKLETDTQALQLGDWCYLRKRVEPSVPSEPAENTVNVSKERKPRTAKSVKRSPVRGSVSLQYYQFTDDSGNERGFKQPGLRVNLRGEELWGGAYAIRVRTRTRYTQRDRPFRTSTDDTIWYNRVYEASVTRAPQDSRTSLALGRIIPRGIPGIGPLDGAKFSFRSGNHQIGAMGGTQPSWQYSDLSTQIQKAGIYYRFSGFKGAEKSPWQSAVAAVSEQTDGEVNREFVHMNLSYRGQRFSAYQSAELDINRDWRKEVTGKSTQLTNLFVSAQYRPSGRITMGLNYDTRRNYRTYELMTEDERYFDDLFRRGIRANLSVKLSSNARVSASYGMRTKEGDDEDATSYYINYYNSRFFWDGVNLNVRTSGFQNGLTDGFNPSLRFGKQFSGGHALFATYSHSEYDVASTLETRTNSWVGLEANGTLGDHFFAQIQLEQNQGDESKGLKAYAEFGYRF